MGFPIYRPRRTRATENLRSMIRETELSVNDLIYPLFVVPGTFSPWAAAPRPVSFRPVNPNETKGANYERQKIFSDRSRKPAKPDHS